MGANAAMETSAELINALLDLRKARQNGLDGLSEQEIKSVFERVQERRFARATRTIAASHELQALNAHEQPMLASLVWKVLMPLAGKHNFFRELSNGIVGASHLEHLPLPVRARALPYDHELPAKALPKSWKRVAWLAFSTAMIFIVYAANGPARDHGVASKLHPFCSVIHKLSPVLIYTIEGYRIGRYGSILSFSMLFTFGMQFRGLCDSVPLWAFLSAAQAEQNPVDRALRPTMARSLVPALVLGILVPTAVLYSLTSDADGRQQDWVSLIQCSPILASALVHIFNTALQAWSRLTKGRPADEGKHPEWYTTADIPLLKSAYAFVFVLQATAHLSTLAQVYAHADLPIVDFLGTLTLGNVFQTPRADVPLTQIAIALQNLYVVWELRGQGYVTTWGAVRAALGVAVGHVVVGSGATWAGLWSWRESVISGMSVGGPA